MKIIYIYERRHCYNYDYDMFQYGVFFSRDMLVEVWSVVNWTFSNKIDMPINYDNSDYVFYINNERELKKELERVNKEKCIFLCYPYHGYNYISYLIRKNIKKYGFDFCNITESPEALDLHKNISLFMFLKVCIKHFRRFIKSLLLFDFKICRDLVFSFLGPLIYRPLKNFITVPIMYYSFPNIFEYFFKNNILLHSSSLDEFLLSNSELLPSNMAINGKYVVFIDQYLTGHSDFKKCNQPYPISDATAYFSQLCYLFEKIEMDCGCKVVIAAHPKAEYKGDEFAGRKIFYGKTNILVKYSEFVIIQFSTVFGLVCLAEKKFLNIYSKEMFINLPILKNDYNSIKNIFGNKFLDISNRNEVDLFSDYLFFNKNKYNDYVNFYINSKESVYNNCLFYEAVYQELFCR